LFGLEQFWADQVIYLIPAMFDLGEDTRA